MKEHIQITNIAQADNVLDEKLIQFLEDADLVSISALETLIDHSKGNEKEFTKLLLQGGYVTDKQFGQIIANLHSWKFIDIDTVSVAPDVLKELPGAFAQAYSVVPFRHRSGDIRFATTNPGNAVLQRILEKKFGHSSLYYLTESMLTGALNGYDEGYNSKFTRLLDEYSVAQSSKDMANRSIIKLLDSIIRHGVRQNASDIHIEPNKVDAIIRERVDGILHKNSRVSHEIHRLLTLRVKVLANLEIDEHIKPQDGKFHYDDLDNKYVDVRVSLVPTTHGEKIVLRLLITQEAALPLSSLGIRPNDEALLQDEIKKSWGMILVTGPTGSGKTTSMYAVLRQLNSDSINISTIEDPVEYDLPGINQIQTHEKAGVTFATGLRAILRQDPNVLFVGEIRDVDTARIAANASLTGHLVLSTLHTNDASTAIPRLRDMGLEPYVISSTVNIIIAQRLVRGICTGCRVSTEIVLKDLQDSLPKESIKQLFGSAKKARAFHGTGCSLCNNTGYQGRIGIFELLRVTDDIRDLILQNSDASTIMKAAVKNGMRTMLDDGIQKVKEGLTTIEEVLRVIRPS